MASLFKRKTKDGRHVWYVTYQHNGKSKMVSTRTGDKRLAMEVLKEIENDLARAEHGLLPARKLKKVLLSEFIEVYIAAREKNRKAENTILADRAAFRNFLDFTGDVLMTTITSSVVRQYRHHRSTNASIATVNMELRHLKAAFFWAIDGSTNKYLHENPFKQKELFLKDEEEYVPLCLMPSEKKAFFEAIDDPDHERLMRFYLLTGCRRNEALDLLWVDIDTEQMEITFRKTKARRNRKVPIGGELMQLISEIDPTRGRPFPYTPNHATHLFKKYARKAGLKEDLHLHCLRHTAASDLARAGVQPMKIQKMLGHSSLEITQIYVHILPEDLREAMEKLTCK